MSTSQATPAHGVRGSQKLLQNLAKNGDAPSIEEIKKALALPPNIEYKIPNWLIRGIPPAYLQLDGTIQVSPAHLADVVNHFVRLNDSTINLNILINGIPIPDIVNIRIQNTGGQA